MDRARMEEVWGGLAALSGCEGVSGSGNMPCRTSNSSQAGGGVQRRHAEEM